MVTSDGSLKSSRTRWQNSSLSYFHSTATRTDPPPERSARPKITYSRGPLPQWRSAMAQPNPSKPSERQDRGRARRRQAAGRHSVVLAFVIAAVLLTPQASFAQTAIEVTSRWGLIGQWKEDCGTAPSRHDAFSTFVVKAGKLFFDRNWGDGGDSSPITSAEVNPDGRLDLVIDFRASLPRTPEVRLNSYVKGKDGRVRVWMNKNVDSNTYSVVNGWLAHSGNPTRWLTRCR